MADGTNLDFFFNLSTHSRPVKRFSCSLLTLNSSEVCSMYDCEHCGPHGWGYDDPHAAVRHHLETLAHDVSQYCRILCGTCCFVSGHPTWIMV